MTSFVSTYVDGHHIKSVYHWKNPAFEHNVAQSVLDHSKWILLAV